MVLLFLEDSTDSVKIVMSIYYKPELLDAETRSKGVEVDETLVPKMVEQFGKICYLKYDTVNNVCSLEYVDRPLTPEEKIAQLESQNAQMLLALVNGGLM